MPGRGDNNKNDRSEPFVNTEADRNAGRPEERVRTTKSEERTFDMVVDSVPYLVKVSPFSFNDETRYNVSINGGENHVFTWDSEVSGLRAIDDSASTLPSVVEEEISARLLS